MAKLPGKAIARKRAKPSKDWPSSHRRRAAGKKVRSKWHYFGSWDDPQARERWRNQRDDLLAGRTPRVPGEGEGCTVRELVNRFLTTKQGLAASGDIKNRTFRDLPHRLRLRKPFSGARLVTDLAVDDSEHLRNTWAKTRGPVALGNEIQRDPRATRNARARERRFL